MAIYARDGVKHLWLLDPRRQRLETYRLEAGAWQASAPPSDPASGLAGPGFQAEPFEAVALDLSNLWKW